MFKLEPCLPTLGKAVPAGPDWIHEIKHDGYRLIVQRDGNRVRLFTRGGYDWSDRFPLITEAAKRLSTPSFVIDGEAVWLDADGRADFDRLHSRKHHDEVQLIAFDLLAVDGDDFRREALYARKAWLARLLAKSANGIQLNPHLTGEIGPAMFEHACKLGLEGVVSKRRDRAYQGGRSKHWVKVKNRSHPAMDRANEWHEHRT
jgi:ATP-dependent DNA ligase